MILDPPPCTTKGCVPNRCAQQVLDQRINENYRFGGRWHGWRLQRGVLISPARTRWTPDTLHAAAAWQDYGLQGLAEARILLSKFAAR